MPVVGGYATHCKVVNLVNIIDIAQAKKLHSAAICGYFRGKSVSILTMPIDWVEFNEVTNVKSGTHYQQIAELVQSGMNEVILTSCGSTLNSESYKLIELPDICKYHVVTAYFSHISNILAHTIRSFANSSHYSPS